MTTLTITDIPNNTFTKKQYSSEEVIKILFQNMNYNIEFDSFSEKESNELIKSSNWNYDKISKLID